MPKADLFARLGLFLVKDFFDAELCARLRSEARSVTAVAATIRKEGSTHVIDESVRKTNRANVSALTKSMVEARLLALQPRVESHFDVVLAGYERPQFLVYKQGDYYGPHQDSNSEPDAPDYVRARRVSVVIFLDSAAGAPGRDAYCGGSLTLYGLIDDSGWKTYGFPLIGEAGLLVAFRSDTVHEVTPLTDGERYTIVSWFF